jgi:chromosomal replication initiation ATPase DnaA
MQKMVLSSALGIIPPSMLFCSACQEQDRRDKMRSERRRRQRTLLSRVESQIPLKYIRARLCHISLPVRNAVTESPGDVGCVLYGPVGRGKSYTLCAFARKWLTTENEMGLLRTTWDRILLDVRGSYSRNAGVSEETIVNKYSQVRRLIIEDLGVTVPVNQEESNFSVRLFTMLIDWRIEHCLPTYITTNKTQTDIGKSFDARIASRLQLFVWIGIGGRDKRVQR